MNNIKNVLTLILMRVRLLILAVGMLWGRAFTALSEVVLSQLVQSPAFLAAYERMATGTDLLAALLTEWIARGIIATQRFRARVGGSRAGVVFARVVRAVIGWGGWPILARYTRRAARATGHVLAAMARAFWCWAGPYVRDAAAWLWYRAPKLFARWLGRQLLRLACWAPGAFGRLVVRVVGGAGWLVALIGRYVTAYPDFAGVVAESIELGRPRRTKVLREAWRRAALRRLAGVLVLIIALSVTISITISTYGPPAEYGWIAGGVVVLAIIGRIVRPPKPREDSEEPVVEPGPEEPYPLADAHTRAEVADCVSRALRAEKVELRMVADTARQPWGWEASVILKRGTPAEMITKLDAIATSMDLPANGVLATPDRGRAARVVLRLAERDPFAGLREARHREPGSLSIRDNHVIGRRMDGTDLSLCLLGVHGVVIGVAGSGKSTTLRAIGDIVTSCVDAVCWDIDPAGNGLDVYGDAIGRRERTPAGIREALADALALAECRTSLLSPLGMGEAWQPSPTHPAVVVVIDEYSRLTPECKALVVEILRTGRKSRVTVILAASEATADTLGDAIADTTALKILHPCRHGDVRLVLGPQRLADGWRPDRLAPATGEAAEDAGKLYAYAAGAREPVVCKVYPTTLDNAHERGAQRARAGIPHR